MKLLGLLLVPLSLVAQIQFVAQKTTNLSGAAEVITVQQPASGPRTVEFRSAYIDCSVACTVTLERNGNAATSTSTPVVPVAAGTAQTATATAWASSNVGTGVVLQVSTISAGGFLVFDLAGITLPPKPDLSQNFTLRTSSITGTVNITIKWTER